MVFNAVTHPFSIEYAKPFSQNYFPASMERVMHILPGRVTWLGDWDSCKIKHSLY